MSTDPGIHNVQRYIACRHNISAYSYIFFLSPLKLVQKLLFFSAALFVLLRDGHLCAILLTI